MEKPRLASSSETKQGSRETPLTRSKFHEHEVSAMHPDLETSVNDFHDVIVKSQADSQIALTQQVLQQHDINQAALDLTTRKPSKFNTKRLRYSLQSLGLHDDNIWYIRLNANSRSVAPFACLDKQDNETSDVKRKENTCGEDNASNKLSQAAISDTSSNIANIGCNDPIVQYCRNLTVSAHTPNIDALSTNGSEGDLRSLEMAGIGSHFDWYPTGDYSTLKMLYINVDACSQRDTESSSPAAW